MTPWMLTEISQLVVTLIVLMGGFGLLLLNAKWGLGLDGDTIGFIKTLMSGWSGFWLGAKVQRNLTPSTTTTILKPDGPVQMSTTQQQS
ncbi:MAG TPA: hypothetical protein VKU60_19905 [Chloroflexota bacterium]|nr:hypothetical protein [Chloroflexota bacterium]